MSFAKIECLSMLFPAASIRALGVATKSFLGNIMKKENVQGCTYEEIEEIERFYGLKLPASYRQWLLKYGRELGGEFVGSDCHYPVLLKLKVWAEELLNDCGKPFVLGKEDFVFLMHQGYQFFYFKSDGKLDEPMVYHYFECWDEPKLVAKSFTEWLQNQAPPNNSFNPSGD
jgi:hypothetical protein